MKVLFTNWAGAKTLHGISSVEAGAVSNYFAQKNGYETIFFGDKTSLLWFKNVKYDEMIELPSDKLDLFPKTAWSIAKLLTVSQINEPFIHLDLDFFLKKDISDDIKSKEAFFFHQEIWMDIVFAKSEFILKRKPKELINNFNKRSFNCSIFGGQNYKAFNKACKIICDFAIENANFLEVLNNDYIELKRKNLVSDYLYLTTLLEQLWMPQLLINDNINIETILTNDQIKEFEKIDYSRDFNPKDLTLNASGQTEDKNKNTYNQYYNLLNNEATSRSLIHMYGKNTIPLIGMLQILINKFNISH